MAFQTPITIKAALDSIWKNDFVLPAIQREFVWLPEQIGKLFDSLMQGFPVGSFLFWRVEKQTAQRFRFFGFVRDYHQRDNPHCPALGSAPNGPTTAVLDGQQRLTALNIALRGSLATKEPNKWWKSPNAFPVKQLYLDLGHKSEPDEEGTIYRFEFLTSERAATPKANEIWFLVQKIFGMNEAYDVMNYLSSNGLGSNQEATKLLGKLHKIVHIDPIISFYEEKRQDIEIVLNIFIRTNSGGTVLSYSDLLLSIASAQWEDRDARNVIHSLVDELNGTRQGFNFSKDFVLKAGLMLSDIASVGFKVENFNRENMKALETNWPKISETLKLTVDLAASFGLSRDTIRADSALLPVAYYLHKKNFSPDYVNRARDANDRRVIKSWLIRSLIKRGIWGSGLDVLLTGLREVIRTDTSDQFPAQALEREMRSKGKTLEFTDEEIEDLTDRKYGDHDLTVLMILLFPFVDTANNQFHVDHIYPRTKFNARKLKQVGFDQNIIADMQTKKELLPNLQLLQGQLNQSKKEKMPADWIQSELPDVKTRSEYISRHLLEGITSDLHGFEAFYDQRRAKLVEAIKKTLSVS